LNLQDQFEAVLALGIDAEVFGMGEGEFVKRRKAWAEAIKVGYLVCCTHQESEILFGEPVRRFGQVEDAENALEKFGVRRHHSSS
jgi:hypothetical protein